MSQTRTTAKKSPAQHKAPQGKVVSEKQLKNKKGGGLGQFGGPIGVGTGIQDIL